MILFIFFCIAMMFQPASTMTYVRVYTTYTVLSKFIMPRCAHACVRAYSSLLVNVYVSDCFQYICSTGEIETIIYDPICIKSYSLVFKFARF